MNNINYRVFRRNNKNLILLWSSKTLTAEQQENLRVYVIENGNPRELSYRPFSPDNPLKFAPDVAGIVLSHSSNGLEPAESCVIRVVFGTEPGEVFELDKEVDPANAATDRPPRVAAAVAGSAQQPPPGSAIHAIAGLVQHMRLYAYNYETKEWVPLPWLASLPDKIVLVKEQP